MSETDAVLNPETRRALRRRVQQLSMLVVGGLIAIVLFGMAGVAALLSVPWQLSLAVTVGVAVAGPVAVPYAMLRVYGLSHQDVIYVAKQAYREGVAEAIALSGTQRTAGVFTDIESTESAETTEDSSSEEMDATESSTENEPIDRHQQTEPQPESQS